MKKVLIIYRTLPQYRIAFYNLLKEDLASKGIALQLIYGDSHFDNRKDSAHLDWARFRKNKVYDFSKFSLIWQPCVKEAREADLVIVEQANRLILNYWLMLRRLWSSKKFAYWGHGLNLQIDRDNVFNKFKRVFLKQTDWWFAYTSSVGSFLGQQGFDPGRITVVQNSLDTRAMLEEYRALSPDAPSRLRESLGVVPDELVFIYCGAYYKEKKIDFLLEALDALAEKGLKFKALFVGSGPMGPLVEAAATERPWMHSVGPLFGSDKALYFSIADIFLHPGAMGLSILDSFVFDTPMVTARYDFHGPEFEYVRDGYNAIVSSGQLEDYVEDVWKLANDAPLRDALRAVFPEMLRLYSNEQMVANFSKGIEEALNVRKG